MVVLQACAFAAPAPGNFISSLFSLEKSLADKGIKTIYAFPERAKDKEWCKEIEKRTKVYFLPEAKARLRINTYKIFRTIYRENKVGIVHSHFELYDIPATVTAPKNARVFWHLHDSIMPGNGLRGILWKLQYGCVGKRATLLAVADYYRNVAVDLGFPKSQTEIVLNGIDLQRIMKKPAHVIPEYDFLTFGWDFERKGDDLIIRACDRLAEEGYQFKLLLNGNESTWVKLDKFLGNRRPAYLFKGNPVANVSELFEKSKAFIQASRRETFSYAVCEAAYAGVPVISSDIAGLEWAHSLSSVRFFENEDVDGLYTQMKALLDGKHIPDCDIYASQEYIKANLSIDAWVQSIISYYNIEER